MSSYVHFLGDTTITLPVFLQMWENYALLGFDGPFSPYSTEPFPSHGYFHHHNVRKPVWLTPPALQGPKRPHPGSPDLSRSHGRGAKDRLCLTSTVAMFTSTGQRHPSLHFRAAGRPHDPCRPGLLCPSNLDRGWRPGSGWRTPGRGWIAASPRSTGQGRLPLQTSNPTALLVTRQTKPEGRKDRNPAHKCIE